MAAQKHHARAVTSMMKRAICKGATLAHRNAIDGVPMQETLGAHPVGDKQANDGHDVQWKQAVAEQRNSLEELYVAS